MIPKQEDIVVYSNSENERGFTINASREAFKILSSGLYANKPQAIIRELSCNAYDSHVMAGYPERPFKIHLPDSWEPFLSIEDFGIGLDDDDINNIYTSYFSSTKRTSNDTIGGKGLGSKTPFSYTDTFTIRARKDSVERVYNAYVSQAGSPTVSLMSETDTDEPNGVLITVPVRQADFNDFTREANNVFKYFAVSPDGWSGDNSIVQELEDNNGMIIQSQSYNAGSVTVVMGSVAYYVKVTESEIPATYTRAWSFLRKSNLIVRFGIGDLSTTASRETIDFDEETKEIFIAKIENVIDEYYAGFQKDVDACDTVDKALNYVERKLGEWAWNILDYKGESLFTWGNKNLLTDILAIVDPNKEFVDGELRILTRGYSNQLSTNILKDKFGEHRITYKGNRHGDEKFIFFMDDTDHGRGFDQTSRAYIRKEYVKHEILLDFVLTADQQTALIELLGDKAQEFITLTEAKEQFKVVREKQKAAAGPRKDPVVRAKKNEIRVDIWENGSGDKQYEERRLIDIDDLSTKRVGHVEISRFQIEKEILNMQWREINTSLLIFLCKVFELDYIVLTRPSQTENVKTKMPYLIDIGDLKLKDVRNNEVVFLYACAKIYKMGMKSFVDMINSKNFDSKMDTKIFNQRNKNVYTKEAEIGKAVQYLDIPEMTNEIRSMDLINKLRDAIDLLTESEINVSVEIVGFSDMTSKNPWGDIYESYADSIADDLYQRNKTILTKYPLIGEMINSIYYAGGKDTDADPESLIYQMNKYIRLIHEDSLRESMMEMPNIDISLEEPCDELYEPVE